MTFRTVIRRSLRFHARSHLGVVLGAIIGSAALIGALVVGDSVRETLRRRALSRLGEIHFALNSGDRFFSSQLLERRGIQWERRFIRTDNQNTEVYSSLAAGATALILPGSAA